MTKWLLAPETVNASGVKRNEWPGYNQLRACCNGYECVGMNMSLAGVQDVVLDTAVHFQLRITKPEDPLSFPTWPEKKTQ